MATVNFLYRSTKPTANLTARLLHTHNGKNIVIAAKTKLLIEKDYWNKQHKSNTRDISIKNKQTEVYKELTQLETHILKEFNKVDVENISKDWLQTQVDYYYNPPISRNLPNKLAEYIDYFISDKQDELSKSTITKYRTIQNKVIDIENSLRKNFNISDINNDFKNEFVKYYKQKGYATNTRQREFAAIKTICRHAKNNGIETHIQLDSLKLPTEKSDKIYLTPEEIEQIENTSFNNEALDNAKDWLIISCFCGQRVSDFLRFTKSMIRTEKGLVLIEFEQQKTKKLMQLPLHPKIIEILKKNEGNFPRKLSDQRYNEHIKEVCRLAGITNKTKGSKVNNLTKRKESGIFPKYELISSHVGRRSFATNNYGTVSTAQLRSITGHSTEEMFLEYIGKTENELAKEIVKYW